MSQFPFQPSTFSFNAVTPALVRQRLGEGADFHLQNGLRVAIPQEAACLN